MGAYSHINFALTLLTYDHLPHIGKGPAYTLSGRTAGKVDSSGPGPGAYHTTSGGTTGIGADGRAFSMSGRPDSRVESGSPGPGAYPPLSFALTFTSR